MKKKLLSLLLALCMILSVCVTLSLTTHALTANDITTAVTNKTGTIEINSQADWDTFANAAKSNTYEGVEIELNTSVTDTAWTPIAEFKGTFDGNGNTIEGLTINGNAFFTKANGATIRNVTFKNCSVTNTDEVIGNVSIVVGTAESNNCTFANVITDACIISSNTQHSGGLIARVANCTVTMEGCQTKNGKMEDKTGSNKGVHGGLVGVIDSATVNMTNCVNGNSVIDEAETGSYHLFGGLVGWNYSNGTLNMTNCVNTGKVHSAEMAGGLVGNSTSTVTANYINCVNKGEVSGKYAGGIVGNTNGGTASITNCVNTGNITADAFAGGLLGFVTTVTVDRAMNTGAVTANKDTSPAVGGIAGKVSTVATMSNCLNTGAINASTASTNDNGVGGIVGSYRRPTGTFEKCINTGVITSTKEYRSANILGFITTSSTADQYILIKDCYFLSGLVTHATTKNNNPAVGTAAEKGAASTNIRLEYTATDYTYTYVNATDSAAAAGSWGYVDKLYSALFNGTDATHNTGAMLTSIDALKGIDGVKLLHKAGFDFVNKWTVNEDGIPVPSKLAVPAPDASLAISYKGYQLGMAGTDKAGSIRFVAGMNDIEGYKATGFDVIITVGDESFGLPKPLTTKTVYESLTANGVEGAIQASKLGCRYLSALEISDMPDDAVVELTATLTPIEGEVIKGTTVVLIIENGAVVAQYAN